MNLLFICDEYPPGKNGGIGTAVKLLAEELAKQGHRIFVAGLYPYSYGAKDYEENNGVRIWRLRYGPDLGGSELAWRVFKRLPSWLRRSSGQKAFNTFTSFIQQLIQKEKIDCIEIADYNIFAQHMGFSVQWPEFAAPLVVKSHGSHTKIAYDLKKKPSPILQQTDRLLYQRADALSAVSRDTAKTNEKLFRPGKKTEVLYNGIEVAGILPEASRKQDTVVYSGSVTPQKGVHQLMKAWNRVHHKHPEAELLIIGKGKTEPFQQLLSGDASKTVHFKGHMERQDLMKELDTATLAVFPSYSETFGLGAVEAMSHGCPVIYTKRSCGPEIINDNENGLLVDPDDLNGLTESIDRLLENDRLREQLGKAGYETVQQRFDIKHTAALHIPFYTSVIEQFKRS